ncbi:ATP-binding protein [Streptomyces sp. NPDC047072]|uniref:sensor histidine kinase n=1 Tax=Streptomyces sp. NPDC047072 TaxID=3154809 RepID=UPI0033FE0F19
MTGRFRVRFRGRRRRLWSRTLRARLVLSTTVTLVVVCVAMAVATVLVQRAHLLAELDQRVRDAADRSQGGLERRAGGVTDLGFLNERGQPIGAVAARLLDGEVTAAEVVTADGTPRKLGAAQLAALAGITADGRLHTRTHPGLGTYRFTAARGDGPAVLAGLPTAQVDDTLGDLVTTEAVIASVGLAVAGAVGAVVIRRQLRPLGRVAATAAEVARAPLDRGEVGGLTRVPAADTDPATEAGQVGVALNRLIDRVESSLAQRQRSEERMRRFLADASHELRTPLASIAGYAELMDKGTAPIGADQAWRRVSAQSARMTGLVEDLLLLARLDEGRPLERTEVNLATVVAEAVWDARAVTEEGRAAGEGGGAQGGGDRESGGGAGGVGGGRGRGAGGEGGGDGGGGRGPGGGAGGAGGQESGGGGQEAGGGGRGRGLGGGAEGEGGQESGGGGQEACGGGHGPDSVRDVGRAGHDWRLALRLDEPPIVVGDAARLTQVVTNLLANARAHTPPGTRIRVSVEATRVACVVRVHDDGPGVPPALLPALFERFTRADSSRSRGRGGGAGLGLAIAAAITEAHGGSLTVESEPGNTEFTVTLPCAGARA